jgi:hypothetical protein
LRRNRLIGSLAIVLLASSSLLLSATLSVDHAQEQRYLQDLKILAAPEMEGRGAGTAGLERASAYIAREFKQLALQPVGENGTYNQNLSVTTGAVPGSQNRLADLRLDQDYRPINFSSVRKAAGPVVFAGFGITAREYAYDDYADMDVKGKVVVVLRHEPKFLVKSGSGKRPKYTYHSHVVNKAINARNHGAIAMVLVNSSAQQDKDELIEFGKMAGPDDVGIPVIHAKRSVAEEWLKRAGESLTALETKIDADRTPASLPLPQDFRLSLQVDIERHHATVHNVLGYLPGKSKEYIIIGAHYDHIGYGDHSSLAPEKAGQVHPGADDNASGTAGLLELARLFSQRRTDLDRGILFAAFAGEEVGLLGSAKWVEQPTLPLQNAVAMINLDMIGRVNGSKLYVGGVGSGSTFEALVKNATSKYDFRVESSFNSSSSSDHASFLAKNIPSLFFFSGLHSDYHRPGDTWNKIDTAASANVVNVVADVVSGLMNPESRPQFARVKTSARSERSAGRSGPGPYFGVVPDYVPFSSGVR